MGAVRARLDAVRRRSALLRERSRDLRARGAAGRAGRRKPPGEPPAGLVHEFACLRAEFAELERVSGKGAFDADAHILFGERVEGFLEQLHAWVETGGPDDASAGERA